MLYPLIRKFFFSLDAETAHGIGMSGVGFLNSAGVSCLVARSIADDPVEAMGLRFPNPVGLAAGLDKNGEHIDALAALGFGFIEIGTITPRPQPGNPRPRLFRIPEKQAIINRMGFNNDGVDQLLANVAAAQFPQARRHSRHQHRQERRHPHRQGGRRLSARHHALQAGVSRGAAGHPSTGGQCDQARQRGGGEQDRFCRAGFRLYVHGEHRFDYAPALSLRAGHRHRFFGRGGRHQQHRPGPESGQPATTFAVLGDFQTWVCSCAMPLGRLEIFTLLVVLTPAFWRK